MSEYTRVPVEPTEEMIEAGHDFAPLALVESFYKAMLAAAPQEDEPTRLERELEEVSRNQATSMKGLDDER